MVHIPTRGDVPVRLGPGVDRVPDHGPSVMDPAVYNDPARFELEREPQRCVAADALVAFDAERLFVGEVLRQVAGDERRDQPHQSSSSISRRAASKSRSSW